MSRNELLINASAPKGHRHQLPSPPFRWSLLTLTLIAGTGLSLVLWIAISRRTTPSRASAVEGTSQPNPSAASATRSYPLPAGAGRRQLMSLVEPPQTAETRRQAARFVSATRTLVLNHAQGSLSLGIETASNIMVPFLTGALTAIRATDAGALGAVREEMEQRACQSGRTDLEDMIFARMVLIETSIGSSRGLNCTMARHQKDDVVLWTLLDAWKDMGQPSIPALAEIRASAIDDRTRRRLLPADEQFQVRARQFFSDTNRTPQSTKQPGGTQ